MTRRTRRRYAHNDDGAILVLALIVVTTIALVVGTVLARGDGSLRATVALREVAGSSYAVDGAAQVTVNDLRTGYGFAADTAEAGFNNSLDGTGCFGDNVGLGGTDTLHLDHFYPPTGSQGESSAVVECAAESGTGMESAPVPINNSNKPGYAIVTLHGPLTAASPLKVHGAIYANGNITGPVNVDGGGIWATGTCTRASATPKNCNTGTPIADPNYANDLGGSVPALQTPPTSCTGGVAVFAPGYYDDAAALSAATSLCPVAWFKPGSYYFDFHNNSCANVCPTSLYDTGNGDVWHTGGGTIVGGTPVDVNGHVLSTLPSTAAVPGACQSPITDDHAVGVQFVFGGDSQISVDQNARVELCGTYHPNRPPIEIYGLKTGSTPTVTSDTGRDVSNGGTVTSSGAFTGATVANLKAGGSGATWTTTTASSQSSTLTIQGFAPSTTVPAGAILTSVTAHLTHRDGDPANANPTATIKIGAATASPPALTGTAASKTSDIVLDASHNGIEFAKLQKEVHAHGYTGATVAYTVNAKKANAVSTVGPITLDLTYYLPVLRGESGTCVDGTSGSCQFISMPGGNNKINLYLQGTTYVPDADVNIKLGNFSAEVSKFGMVTRQLEFAITNGNPTWTGPIFEIPDNSPGYGYENTTVDLTVHVCPGQPTGCTTSAPVALTARVQLWDPHGDPTPPGRQITILSWSHTR